MKNNLLLLIALFIFSTLAFAEDIQIKSLNQGSCWIKEDGESVKVSSFIQGMSTELNNQSLSMIHDLGLPTTFSESFEVKAFCSGHGLSLVFNVVEKSLRYCIWLKVNKDSFTTQSVGLTDSEGKCDGYSAGEILLSLDVSSLEREDFIKDLEQRSAGIQFKSFEEVSEGLIKVVLLDEDLGRETEVASKFNELKQVKYAERSYFYHPIGEWSDLDSLGRE